MSHELISVVHVTQKFKNKIALNDVSLSIREGETLGLVGESGSGKTTLGHIFLQLLKQTSGNVFYKGELINKSNRRHIQKKFQIIFQDPYSSLNPKMTALQLVAEPLLEKNLKHVSQEKARNLLARVGIEGNDVNKHPYAFSGGQRQRIGIARAIVANPEFILADEPISALDVSIQAQIVNLLSEMKEEKGLTYLFISHDLGKVEFISDRVAVLYHGHLMELGPTELIFSNPQHDYTKRLLSAIPSVDIEKKQLLDQLENLPPIHIGNEWREIEPEHFVLI